MARIRTIKPEFWGSPKTARCSRDARLLFLGLLNESDDEGRQLGSERRIAGVVFPNDPDVDVEQIEAWLNELEHAGFVRRYEVDNVPYLLICGFVDHQKVSHPTPSRLPPAPRRNRSREAPEPLGPDLGIDLGIDLGSPNASHGSKPPWLALNMTRYEWKDAGSPMPEGYEPALVVVPEEKTG